MYKMKIRENFFNNNQIKRTPVYCLFIGALLGGCERASVSQVDNSASVVSENSNASELIESFLSEIHENKEANRGLVQTFSNSPVAPYVPGSLFDIDGDGYVDGLTDGMLLLRFLFGVSVSDLIAGDVVSPKCTRCTAAQIMDYSNKIRASLDADGDGSVKAMTDGYLVVRFLFGIRGPNLIYKAVDPKCKRCQPEEISQYLTSLMTPPKKLESVVRGRVYIDPLGEGTHQSSYVGLSKWRVYSDLNNNGKFDSGEPTTFSNAKGEYELTLSLGQHRLKAQLEDGWIKTSPKASAHVVNLSSVQTLARHFGNAKKPFTGVEGYVYNDIHKDGMWNNSRQGLAKWRVYSDLNRNNRWDANEPYVYSDEKGFYNLELAPQIRHDLKREDRQGWSKTTPIALAHVVTLSEGTKVVRHFGNYYGVNELLDIDGNGLIDPLTDGVLIVRSLLGVTGAALVENALADNCVRCTPQAVASYTKRIHSFFDIDGDGKVDALTDGALIHRFMLGLRGKPLVDQAVGSTCKRCTPESVFKHFLTLVNTVPNIKGLFDVDGDGVVSADTDGRLIARFMFGNITGNSLTEGIVGKRCTRCSPGAIKFYLNNIKSLLDIDDDGTLNPLADGILIGRYMMAIRDPKKLTDGAVASKCNRCHPLAILSYLDGLNTIPPTVINTLFDVDGDGVVHAKTDGVLITRYMFGFDDGILVKEAVGKTCTRCSPKAIKMYLDNVRPILDIDNNGKIDALTDGVMISRHMFGFVGSKLVEGAVGRDCQRCKVSDISKFLRTVSRRGLNDDLVILPSR